MSDRDEFGAFLIGFVVGGLTGAAVSLLFAPKSGEETRALIKERAIELREKATETAQSAAEQVNSIASEARIKIEELANLAKSKVEELQKGGVVLEKSPKTEEAPQLSEGA